MVRLSGTFMVKVFAGPLLRLRRWRREMETLAFARGRKVERIFYSDMAACTICSRAYSGHHFIVYAMLAPHVGT